MVRKSIKFTFYFTAVFIVLSSILSGLLALWLATGTRTMPYLSVYIENYLNALSPGHDVTIKSNRLIWKNWQNALNIEVFDITIHDDNNQVLTNIPSLTIDFGIWNVITGNYTPSNLIINSPTINIPEQTIITNEETIEFSYSLASLHHSIAQLVQNFAETQERGVPLNRIAINNATINLPRRNKTHITWQINDAAVNVERRLNKTLLTTTIESKLSGKDLPLKVDIELDAEKTMHMRFAFNDLSSQFILEQFSPETINQLPQSITKSSLTASGWVKAISNQENGLEAIDLNIIAGHGELDYDKLFPDPVIIKNLSFRGSLSNNYSTINIATMQTLLEDQSTIDGVGTISFDGGVIKSDFELDLQNIPTEKLSLLWPVALAPSAREWVTTNVSGGDISRASGHFILHTDLTKTENATTTELVDSTIHFSGVNSHYIDNFHDVKNASGTITFTNESMDIAIEKAEVNNTEISNGHIEIKNFQQSPLMMDITANTKGNIDDLVHIYNQSSILAERKDISILGTSLDLAKGKAEGKFSLLFSLTADSGKALEYNVSAKLQEASLPNILNKYNITDATLDLTLDNNTLTLSGQAKANDLPVTLEGSNHFNDDSSKYIIRTQITSDKLPELYMPELPYIENSFYIGIIIQTNQSNRSYFIEADLQHTDINVPLIHWIKKADTKAILTLEAIEKENTIDITNFHFESLDLTAHGHARLNSEKELTLLTFNQLKTGLTDIRARYINDKEKQQILLSGTSLDISALLNDSPFKNNDESDKKKFDIRANIKQLVLLEGNVFYEVTGNLYCSPRDCISANLDAALAEGKYVTLSYQPNGQSNQLFIESDNGGSVLSALGLYQNAKGGHLRLDANYFTSEESGNNVLQGEIILRDFHVVKTPVFAKLLSLASFTGLLDLLNGDGIPFTRFTLPFIYEKGVLTMKEAHGHGNSIGLTLEGRIDVATKELDLNGTLVPAYILNQAVGNLPLIGEALTGGKGQGLVAAAYKITGTSDNPKISTNPLSMLTPGFLRGIFDIFSR